MTIDDSMPAGEILLYQSEDGRTRIECRFENETLWLSQAMMADLFQVTIPTINEHLKGIYAEDVSGLVEAQFEHWLAITNLYARCNPLRVLGPCGNGDGRAQDSCCVGGAGIAESGADGTGQNRP